MILLLLQGVLRFWPFVRSGAVVFVCYFSPMSFLRSFPLRPFVWALACLAAQAPAWMVETRALADQPATTSSLQLDEMRQTIRPEYTGFLAFGWVFLPLPSQAVLHSEWGEHDGFAFRQRFAAWLTNPVEKTPLRVGLAWWFERQGWDQEDFMVMPAYGRFARIQSIQTFGMTLTDSLSHWGVAAGGQFRNTEMVGQDQVPAGDSLYWWGLGEWGPATVQALYKGRHWREARFSLDAQSRAVRGGDTTGWLTYLPDVSLALRNSPASATGADSGKDAWSLDWEQNVFAQKVYVAGLFDGYYRTGHSYGLHDVLSCAYLRLYPDPSRLVALEGTYDVRDKFFGGGVSLPFLRVAYNHVDDRRAFFGARGLWVIEFHIAIGSSADSFFGTGGAHRAPVESKLLKGPGSIDPGEVESSKIEGGKQ